MSALKQSVLESGRFDAKDRDSSSVRLCEATDDWTEDLHAASPAMRRLVGAMDQAARSTVTILLEGESGVGKEVLARAIHERSPRAAGPFVVVDCGAISRGLFEGELFGHVRGAFTGAFEDRKGLFEAAHGGTLFLDEIGELPVELQPKLLRVLEQREVRPVGGRTSRRVDVRIVAATNRSLADECSTGHFRVDLFYRLAVARLVVPPLRERKEDIVPLAKTFLRSALGDPHADITARLASALLAHDWRGNVRELRNFIECYGALGGDEAADMLTPGEPLVEDADLAKLPYQEARRIVVERFEREYFRAVLSQTGGVMSRAARHSKLARPSLYRMMDRLGMTPGRIAE